MIRQLPRLAPTHRRMLLAQRVAELQDATATSLIATAPHPDFEAMARKADPHDDTRRARILAAIFEHGRSHTMRESIAATMVNGMALSMWAERRQGLPIVPAHRLPAAQFREDVGNVSTPEDAISYWRTRIPLTPEQVAALRSALQQMYTAALPAAMEYSQAVMDGIVALFAKALSTGMPLTEFRAAFADEIPNLARNVVETIYRTTLSKAMGAQTEIFIRKATERYQLFLQWLAVGDDRTRATHLAMDGYVARSDDVTWMHWKFPAGYQCRCKVSVIPYTEAIRRGWMAYTSDRRSFTYPMGLRPAGDPPAFVYDPKRKMLVRVAPDPGFDGGSQLLSIIAA